MQRKGRGVWIRLALLVFVSSVRGAIAAPANPESQWLERFRFVPPTVETRGVCRPGGAMPEFSIGPARPGRQLVRVSLPFAPGAFPAELGLTACDRQKEIEADVRVLTCHPGTPRFIRRAIVTFPDDFPDLREREFHLRLRQLPVSIPSEPKLKAEFRGRIGKMEIHLQPASGDITRDQNDHWTADLLAPPRTSTTAPSAEIIEQGRHYLWVRILVPDPVWPRIIELRADSTGTVAVRAHLQRFQPGDGTAPDLGWSVRGPRLARAHVGGHDTELREEPSMQHFNSGADAWLDGPSGWLRFPDAALLRRGQWTARTRLHDSEVVYYRCRAEEKVPHQEAAWRTAAFAIGPIEAASLNALLEPSHAVHVAARYFHAADPGGRPQDLSAWPVLEQISQFHREAIVTGALQGDDSGNVTYCPAYVFGQNRFNHGRAIFDEYHRSGDARLRQVAIRWCENFHDLTIWWGLERAGQFGGTRYPNVLGQKDKTHLGDRSFMWRSNGASDFCTKGFDTFWDAYEETGDPRLATALRWQTAYARENIHVRPGGQARNIGVTGDFLRLYQVTGNPAQLNNALRLFRELRPHLSAQGLFDQRAEPISDHVPFIDNDDVGLKQRYAKPYILGYALLGLPELLQLCPDEPRLHDVVRGVSEFLVSTLDPAGGWRYPHPRSQNVVVQQGMEHAAQIVRAARVLEVRGESIDSLLDAVECVLQSRILTWQKTGQFLGTIGGWEEAVGLLRGGKRLADLYKKPEDRDPSRDYTEGSVVVGGASPEGVVYFPEVLEFYLAHRPAERLMHANPKLQILLQRMKPRTPVPGRG